MKKCLRMFTLLAAVAIFPASVRSASVPATEVPPDGKDLGDRFRLFADLKEKEVGKAAHAKGVIVPSIVPLFFEAVKSRQWASAQYLFANFRDIARRQELVDDAALMTGLQDVSGVYELMADWEPTLVDVYCEEALRAIPDGSVIFGGTDAGRFLITYGSATLRTGRVTVVTQNQLAENSYADYIRTTTSNKLSMFTTDDSTSAFKEYTEDVKAGRRSSRGTKKTEDGRIQITGVQAVMQVNGILAKKLFESNRSTHSFYIQESYSIAWTYDHLLPHGLIMKLSPEPVTELTSETVTADQAYWKRLEARLNSTPDSEGTHAANKAFSKCRCAIAGIYEHHGMRSEAEDAFRQALRLCPSSSEARLRLANVLCRMKNYDAAERVMSEYLELELPAAQVRRVTHYLEGLRKLRDSEQPPEPDK